MNIIIKFFLETSITAKAEGYSEVNFSPVTSSVTSMLFPVHAR